MADCVCVYVVTFGELGEVGNLYELNLIWGKFCTVKNNTKKIITLNLITLAVYTQQQTYNTKECDLGNKLIN